MVKKIAGKAERVLHLRPAALEEADEADGDGAGAA